MKLAKPTHDKHKSDAFSLGLIILEAGLLKSVQKIYDRSTGKIKQNELHSLIEEFSNRYVGDYDLVQAVRSMLVVSELDRTSFTELKMQYASNLSLRDLAKSNDFQEFNYVDVRTSEISVSRNHNPMNTAALGTNRAYNPIANDRGKQRYGTDYMNFDDGNEDLSYWNNEYQYTKNHKETVNPLTGGLFYKRGDKVNRKPFNGVNINGGVNYYARRSPGNDVRNPLSDYNGFGNKEKKIHVERRDVGKFRY